MRLECRSKWFVGSNRPLQRDSSTSSASSLAFFFLKKQRDCQGKSRFTKTKTARATWSERSTDHHDVWKDQVSFLSYRPVELAVVGLTVHSSGQSSTKRLPQSVIQLTWKRACSVIPGVFGWFPCVNPATGANAWIKITLDFLPGMSSFKCFFNLSESHRRADKPLLPIIYFPGTCHYQLERRGAAMSWRSHPWWDFMNKAARARATRPTTGPPKRCHSKARAATNQTRPRSVRWKKYRSLEPCHLWRGRDNCEGPVERSASRFGQLGPLQWQQTVIPRSCVAKVNRELFSALVVVIAWIHVLCDSSSWCYLETFKLFCPVLRKNSRQTGCYYNTVSA